MCNVKEKYSIRIVFNSKNGKEIELKKIYIIITKRNKEGERFGIQDHRI